MGWCHEFGVAVETGCGHPMVAGSSACSCAQCGTVCSGRFEGGCQAVWERGPRADAPFRPVGYLPRAVFEPAPVVVAPPEARPREASANGYSPDAGGAAAIPVDASGQLLARLGQLEAVIGRLAEQLARQSERQTRLETHLGDLGKVVAQHGTEVDDQLVLFELVLDDLNARAAATGEVAAQAVRAASPEPEPPPELESEPLHDLEAESQAVAESEPQPEPQPEPEPVLELAEPLPFPMLSAVRSTDEPPEPGEELPANGLHHGPKVHRLP